MDGILQFCEWAGAAGCYMEHFGFWVIYGISTSAGWSVGGHGLENVGS